MMQLFGEIFAFQSSCYNFYGSIMLIQKVQRTFHRAGGVVRNVWCIKNIWYNNKLILLTIPLR